MEAQLQSLSNQIFHIKDKITDLQYYNLMATLQLIHKSSATDVEFVIPFPPSISSTSSIAPSAAAAASPPPSSNTSSSNLSCCCNDSYNCCC